MISTLLAALVLAPGSAQAGGLGLILNGGAHADRVYGYEALANGTYEQMEPETQFNAHGGGGLEIVLGDRDNSVLGVFRGYYLVDAGQSPVEGADVSEVRETARPVGMATAGLQWGVWGEPDALQAVVTANAGAGLFTSDMTEFLDLQVGGGATWMATSDLQVLGTVTAGTRYRKRFFPEAGVTVGVRYLFD